MSLKSFTKDLLALVGYRVVASRHRWGIDLVDDFSRIAGNSTENQIFFDVGANTGQTAARFASAFPNARIYSFEPFLSSFEILRGVARRFGDHRVKAFNLGVSDTEGSLPMRMFDDSEKNTFEAQLTDSMRHTTRGKIACAVETLDGFCRRQKVDYISLLKIDVEGHELPVLRGAQRLLTAGRIQGIYAEFHTVGMRFRKDECPSGGHTDLLALAEFLTPLGYRMVTVYTDSVHEDEPIGTYNALFVIQGPWQPSRK